MMILRSLLGIAVLTAVLWLFSSNKRKVNWAMVGKGLLLQFVLALAVLKVPGVSWAFEKFSLVAVTLLDFTREGSTFLFGSLITETDNFGYLFAFQVLPTVIFFSAVTSLLYYYGILQRVVKGDGMGHAENVKTLWCRVISRSWKHLYRSNRSAASSETLYRWNEPF
jgi:CNT family concentrative nucleoside transporter